MANDRIDVVKKDKTVTVLVNFGSMGAFSYSTVITANKEATALHDNTYPHAQLNLLAEPA